MTLRKTKIVCTIGPSSCHRKTLERMLQAGMDVARLNFSHSDHAWHAEVIASLREISQKMGKPLALLQDLCGPKIRLGDLGADGVSLKRGQVVGFIARDTLEPPTKASENLLLPLPVPELLAALQPGRKLLLDDGKILLRVLRTEPTKEAPAPIVWARCLSGGKLLSRKGVAAPGTPFSIPALTSRDLDDLRFGLSQGVDWVAVSFVRHAEDLQPIFSTMQQLGVRVPVMAKIEKAEAVHHFEAILEVVDGVMVARGDLGVEMRFDEVPIVQKQLIRACNRAAKPVVTATQMLESMVQCPRPTRAEAADVANAILDGTDAVMLSAETASGAYPVEAVRTMARIALTTEKAFFRNRDYAERLATPHQLTEAVGHAAAQIACEIGAKAILCATSTGRTARLVASHRPPVRILGATPSRATYHALAMVWGVQPCLVEAVKDTDSMMRETLDVAQRLQLVRPGDTVVLTAGVPVNRPGTTNLIRVHTVGTTLEANPLAHS
ncbi:MAG TPA: pyruvate kinase [Chthonomonas sp.]|uniref:pyruvate kinase n=1 Tax=Chthonomonas sp. TaxID=2282153 RepID=UPI002B4AC51F|nr:pyruvate kinase [Chthonomonas sp.]HLH80598.1 pyruvate kinase [Chthonomonas sp.]